jgi:pectate lyase
MVPMIVALAVVVVALVPRVGATQAAYEGFGAATPGGAGRPVYRVTNLNNSGPGSLRDALSQSNRYIVFDVGGTINTPSEIVVRGRSFITIDGSTAPAPGITLDGGGGLSLHDGSHDIIIRHIRVRNAQDDGFRVYNAHDIVFDHVSAYNSGDGNLDITEGAYNVTVQWSLFRQEGGSANMLIGYGAHHVTLHHNLFWAGERNPMVDGDFTNTLFMADVRNNIIWNWGDNGGRQWGFGTGVDRSGWANVINNFYEAHGSYPDLGRLALELNHNGGTAQVFTSGNVSGNGANVNRGNVSAPFPASLVTTEPTCTAAARVLREAGALPLDSIDWSFVSQVALGGCPEAGPSPVVGGLSAPRLSTDQCITGVSGPWVPSPTPASLAVAQQADGPIVFWSGIPSPMPMDWVGLYWPGASVLEYLEWIYVGSCTKTAGAAAATGSCVLPIPATLPAGTYEVRLYANDGAQLIAPGPHMSIEQCITGD